MSGKETDWKPDEEETLKLLIRETILAMGAGDPTVLPHKIKERLHGRATGDLDVDEYIKQVLAETKKR